MATTIGRVEDAVFEQVLSEPARVVEDAVISHQLIGEKSLNVVTERLAALFGTTKGDALQLLGVSRTRASRNPKMDVVVLDRAGIALKLYARVASMVGSEGAGRWFSKSNRHLEGKRPIELLISNLGRARVDDLVTALEDGAYL